MKKTAQLLVKLSPDLRNAFQIYARRHGRSASELVRHLMEDEMRSGRMVDMLKPRVVEGRYGPAAHVLTDDGRSWHVQVTPFRSQTMLTVLNGSFERDTQAALEARGRSSLLDRILTIVYGDYDWDTPDYREVCLELGLDPDRGRPTYKDSDKEIVARLEKHIDWSGGGDDAKLNHLIFDLLDLLRTDQSTEFFAYADAKQTLEHWPFKLARTLFDEAFNRIDVQRIRSSRSVLVGIDFLPSWEGAGYTASIYLWGQTNCEPDGWGNGYSRLKGVALAPTQDDLATEAAVRRLEDQGVVFLSDTEARAYLEQEGAYWAYQRRFSRCPNGMSPRVPSASERLLWRVKRPATPLYDRHQQRTQALRLRS